MTDALEGLRNKLTTMNENWEKHQRALLEDGTLQIEYKSKMMRIEKNLLFNVLDAKDPETEKPIYSNEKAREAALQKKKDASDEYINLKDKYIEVTKKIKESQTEIEILKFQARNARYMCDIELARINYKG